jgi:serine protease Do
LRNASILTFLLSGGLLVTTAAQAVADAAVSAQDIAAVKKTGEVFAHVAGRAAEAVVFVDVKKAIEGSQGPMAPGDLGGLFERFFRFGPPGGMDHGHRHPHPHQQIPVPRRRGKAPKRFQRGQGSGFLVSADGYILTNNHVVGDADEVSVKLKDGREFEAKIVGTDPASDVALVKIEAEGLPYLELGDSDALRVGNWVLAIGSPFGLSHTVTSGIVSATGRSHVGIVDYENFIQTDAAINPGNSGGPLIDLDGKVVGINTAILSRSGASAGIGFAIPANMARDIYLQLKSDGKVTRGYLGIVIQDVDEALAKSFGLKSTEGILVSQVQKGGAADKGGLQVGDVILEFDGKQVDSTDTFRNRIAMTRPGSRIGLQVIREGTRKGLMIKVGERKEDGSSGAASAEGEDMSSEELAERLGFRVQELDGALARRFGYEGDEGLLVAWVAGGSQAAESGLRPGVLIVEVNRRPVASLADFERAVGSAKAGDGVLLRVQDGDFTRFLVLELE